MIIALIAFTLQETKAFIPVPYIEGISQKFVLSNEGTLKAVNVIEVRMSDGLISRTEIGMDGSVNHTYSHVMIEKTLEEIRKDD